MSRWLSGRPLFQLDYSERETDGPSVCVYLQDCKTAIAMPTQRAVRAALAALRAGATEPALRRQAWQLIHCVLVGTMSLADDRLTLQNLFTHYTYAGGRGTGLQPGIFIISIFFFFFF